jgi:drug/metabolite transporter (DMT)-like permease
MVIWGATPVMIRIATDDLEPLLVAVLRTVLAGLVAAPLLLARGERPPASGAGRGLLAVSAAAGFVLFPVVYTVGQQRTSAMHGAMILAALPVLVLAAALIVAAGYVAGALLVPRGVSSASTTFWGRRAGRAGDGADVAGGRSRLRRNRSRPTQVVGRGGSRLVSERPRRWNPG